MNEVNNALPGLTISSPLFFKADESIDYETLGCYLDDVCANKNIFAVYSMAYNTRYRMLDTNEILTVNQFIIRKVKEHKHRVFVGHPYTFTKKTLSEYLGLIKKEEPDGISMLYPERYFGISRPIIDFLRLPISHGMDVVLHEMKLVSGFNGELVDWPDSLLEEVFSSVPLVAIKEDSKNDDVLIKTLELCKQHKVNCIVAGGGKQRALKFIPLGLKTWLNGSTMFAPALIDKIYAAIMHDDHQYIDWYMQNIEIPFFDGVVNKVGWHLAHKVALEYFGYGSRYERFPHAIASNADLMLVEESLGKIKNAIRIYDRS